MTRTKITAYVTPEFAETLRRLAAIDDRSLSDVIEDAIARRVSTIGREAEHAAILARLDHIVRRLTVIEQAQESQFELTAHTARFAMSLAPEIPDAERQALNARGSERLRNILKLVAGQLSSGRGLWRDMLATPQPREAAQ